MAQLEACMTSYSAAHAVTTGAYVLFVVLFVVAVVWLLVRRRHQ
jgi:uncharacterized protein (TIGR03382 family)